MFGQIVIGPPGSGKTTYCNGMQQFLTAIGRKVAVINLDPANDGNLPYDAAASITEIIELEEVMEKLELGPNGAMVYCMEYLEKNIDWLKEKLKSLKGHYFIFDFPGQVELYTHHDSVRNIVQLLTKLNYRLCAVHLVDSHYCSDPCKYMSVVMVALSTMMKLEMPHINILSKIDLIEAGGKLEFGLEFYTDVLDLPFLAQRIADDPNLPPRYAKLNAAMADVLDGFGMLNFHPLNIQDKHNVHAVLCAVDKANGYVFTGMEGDNLAAVLGTKMGETDWKYNQAAAFHEMYMEQDGEDVVADDDDADY